MICQHGFGYRIGFPLLIGIIFLVSCTKQQRDELPHGSDHSRDSVPKDSLNILVSGLRLEIISDTLTCSYTIHNSSRDREAYVNAYSWTIQNGDVFGYGVPDHVNNIGNVISLFRGGQRGSQMEYFTPAYPWIQAQLCVIRPGKSTKITMHLRLQPDSLDWVRNYKSVVVGVPVWTRLSDSLRRQVSIVQSDDIQVLTYRPYSGSIDKKLYIVKQGQLALHEQVMKPMYTALQNERSEHVYYQDSR